MRGHSEVHFQYIFPYILSIYLYILTYKNHKKPIPHAYTHTYTRTSTHTHTHNENHTCHDQMWLFFSPDIFLFHQSINHFLCIYKNVLILLQGIATMLRVLFPQIYMQFTGCSLKMWVFFHSLQLTLPGPFDQMQEKICSLLQRNCNSRENTSDSPAYI